MNYDEKLDKEIEELEIEIRKTDETNEQLRAEIEQLKKERDGEKHAMDLILHYRDMLEQKEAEIARLKKEKGE